MRELAATADGLGHARAAKRLEANGLLTRERDPEDERRVILSLTDRAREIEPEVRGIQCQVTDDTHTALDDLLQLRDQLKELTDKMTRPAS